MNLDKIRANYTELVTIVTAILTEPEPTQQAMIDTTIAALNRRGAVLAASALADLADLPYAQRMMVLPLLPGQIRASLAEKGIEV